jgi:hypothetical protein
MDYAFAPGTSDYDNMMKDLFNHRPNTALINQAGISRVDQFIDHLETDAGVTRPLENIVIATHGNDGGWMEIQFANIDVDGDGVPEVNTTYEVVEIADTSNVVEIPAIIQGAASHFHIKGCKIGQDFAIPFVTKIKAALGGVVPVTAPKHFHEVWYRTDLGVLEYLGYDFSVVQPTRFANRNAVLAAFGSAGLLFIDNSAIPANYWRTRIPANVGTGRQDRTYTVNLSPSLTPTNGSTMNSLRLTIEESFRHDEEHTSFTISYSGGSPPASEAGRKADMKTSMAGELVFQAAHPFPIYARFEYNNLTDFVDGFTWAFTYDKKLQKLHCVGTRHRYTLIVPITDPANNNLFYNFYPYAGTATPVTTQLPETDARFFLTV